MWTAIIVALGLLLAAYAGRRLYRASKLIDRILVEELSPWPVTAEERGLSRPAPAPVHRRLTADVRRS